MEACRLLGSYLRDLDPSFTYKNEVGQRIYRLAAARARKNGWSADKFWGWEPEMAQRVAKRFAQPNERFAEAVWGTTWPIPLPADRPQATVNLIDLPDVELEKVRDFVDAMTRRYVELRKGGIPRRRKADESTKQA